MSGRTYSTELKLEIVQCYLQGHIICVSLQRTIILVPKVMYANGYMLSEGNANLYIIPYQNTGFASGYGGQEKNLNYVTIITQRETDNIINVCSISQ